MGKADRGDCFSAGFIYGLYQKHTTTDIIDFAVAAAVGKLYKAGDATMQRIEDVKTKNCQ